MRLQGRLHKECTQAGLFAIGCRGKYNWAEHMEHTVYLALGANVGDTQGNLRAAVRLLREGGCRVEIVSSMYLTKPVGITDQPEFFNAVIGARTTLSPLDVLR